MSAVTRMRYIFLLLFLLAVGGAGCSVRSASHPYAPPSGSYESQLFIRARTDLFPDDVRSKNPETAGQLLLWTGIVRSARIENDSIITEYEHHYWDFVEDFGLQQARIFLSPRGEGAFRCKQSLAAFSGSSTAPLPVKGALAVVYGIAQRVDRDGTVVLDCPPLMKTVSADRYTTKMWDYGRSYLLHGDRSDFHILTVPEPLRSE